MTQYRAMSISALLNKESTRGISIPTLLNKETTTDQPEEFSPESFPTVHQADENNNDQTIALKPTEKALAFAKITFEGPVEAIVQASLQNEGVRFHIILKSRHPQLRTQTGVIVRFQKSMIKEVGLHELYDIYKATIFLQQSNPEIKHRLMVLNKKISSPYESPPMPAAGFFDPFFQCIEAWREKNHGCLYLATPSGILIGEIECQMHRGQRLCIEAWWSACNKVYFSFRRFDPNGKTHQGEYLDCVKSLFPGALPTRNNFGILRDKAPQAFRPSLTMTATHFAQWVRVVVDQKRSGVAGDRALFYQAICI
ncbi:MAG: hypothetical protein Q9214_002221 [Letrouitia sp. 1 TL-2023]